MLLGNDGRKWLSGALLREPCQYRQQADQPLRRRMQEQRLEIRRQATTERRIKRQSRAGVGYQAT